MLTATSATANSITAGALNCDTDSRLDSVAHILGLVLLFVGCGLALCSLLLGLPGTFIIVAIALLYGWATGFATIQWSTIGWLALLAVAGELLELLSAGAGAARARPSRRVTIGALCGAFIGGVLGAPLLFGIGALLGALAGAFAGAALVVRSEGGSVEESLATGMSAMRGRFVGFIIKTAFAVAMVVIIAAAVL